MANSPAIAFKRLSFAQLSLNQLYEIMVLRQMVFVVEQHCPYLDADGKDQGAYHQLAYNDREELVAYTRLLAPGVSYPGYASIGRVITRVSERGAGLGRTLMQESITGIAEHFGTSRIKISAQCYLTDFYESLGFQTYGGSYLEDGIPHIAMVKE